MIPFTHFCVPLTENSPCLRTARTRQSFYLYFHYIWLVLTVLKKYLLQGKVNIALYHLKNGSSSKYSKYPQTTNIPKKYTRQLFGYKHLKGESNFTVEPWKVLQSLKYVISRFKNSSRQNSIYAFILLFLRIKLPPQ